MAAARLAVTVEQLLARGWRPATPVTLIRNASRPDQSMTALMLIALPAMTRRHLALVAVIGPGGHRSAAPVTAIQPVVDGALDLSNGAERGRSRLGPDQRRRRRPPHREGGGRGQRPLRDRCGGVQLVPRPGSRFPVPVAVVPLALAPVRAALQERVYRGAVRIAVRKHGPVITDHGNPIVDAWPPDGFDAACGEAELAEPRSCRS